MKKLIIIFIITCSGAFSYAQDQTKKVEKDYNHYSYSKVIERAEGRKAMPIAIQRELAESYKRLGQYQKCETQYEKLALMPEKAASDVLAYAQILRMNGKYAAADEQMTLYGQMNATDSRVIELNKNKNYLQFLLVDNGYYKIKNLDLNSAEQDFGPAYYKNQLVYTSSRADISASMRKWNGNNLSFLDVYIADVDSQSAELEHSKRLNLINRKYHEGPISYSEDGKVVFYTRNNYNENSSDGVTTLELYESTDKDGVWSEATPFQYNNKEYSVGQPALSADGHILYFASDMPGGKGGTDLYRCERLGDGTWSAPVNLGDTINSEGNEMFPFLNDDDMLFFSSDGHPGLGGLDVFVTPMSEHISQKVINLGVPLNSSKDDFSFIMNKEHKKGYFASNREGGKGDDDIYSVVINKGFNFGVRLKGKAVDKNGEALGGTVVNLYSDGPEPLLSTFTKKDGTFKFDLVEPTELIVTGIKSGYFGDRKNILPDSSDEKEVTLVLEKNPGYTLYALITDNKSKQIIEGAHVKITDVETGKVIEFVTGPTGDYRKLLDQNKWGDNLSYNIEIKKEGYLSKILHFEKVLDKAGDINLHENLDISLAKIEVGIDIGALVNLKPIYFDVDKSNIRKDAAVELDKIVNIMLENKGMEVELGSHTDCRATASYNLSLSDRRAKASATYIINKGIS
ncbi:MAG: OmpA family protein, partial [Bacteroidota bacterium]